MKKPIVTANIKRLIKDKGLVQGAFAVRAGYKEKEFCDMMHGRKIISDTDVWNIACTLDVTPNDLYTGCDKK